MSNAQPKNHLSIYTQLENFGRVRTGVMGKDLTTFNIGGPIAVLFEPSDATALQSAVQLLDGESAPYRIIGAGSNIIISDSGISETVIKLGQSFRATVVTSETAMDVTLEVGAAASLMTLSRTSSENGWSGLEFAGGIPASIGGAVIMNAGAHGSEIASVLKSISVLKDGTLLRLPATGFPFAYRHSGIEAGAIIVGAELLLRKGDKEKVSAYRAEMLSERKLKQPLTFPSAGSVFRNPSPEQSAGRVIEQCGLKGMWCGGAQIAELHANWIVNPKREATAADVKSLMQTCIDNALKVGIHLQPELITW